MVPSDPFSPAEAVQVLTSVPHLEETMRRRVRAVLDSFCGFVALLGGMSIAYLASSGALRTRFVGDAVFYGWMTLFVVSTVLSKWLTRRYALEPDPANGPWTFGSRQVPHDLFVVMLVMGVSLPSLVTFGTDLGIFPTPKSILWEAVALGMTVALFGVVSRGERGDRLLRIGSGLLISGVALLLVLVHPGADFGAAYAMEGVLVGVVMTGRGIIQVLRG